LSVESIHWDEIQTLEDTNEKNRNLT
jgi:hypothetical protein